MRKRHGASKFKQNNPRSVTQVRASFGLRAFDNLSCRFVKYISCENIMRSATRARVNFLDAQNYTRAQWQVLFRGFLYALKQNFHQTTHAFEAFAVLRFGIILIKFVYGNQE